MEFGSLKKARLQRKKDVPDKGVTMGVVTEEIVDNKGIDNKDIDIQKLVEILSKDGEGALRDYLFRNGFEIGQVDGVIERVHLALKSGAGFSDEGMYCNGGVKALLGISDGDEIDGDDIFDDEVDEVEIEKSKKSKKKSLFDDPVEEVLSVLGESESLPVVLVRSLLVNDENYNRLLDSGKVEVTKYQVILKVE